MYCPFCHANDTKVIDSRLVQDGYQIRRRRECLKCELRFTTHEKADLTMPKIVKRDGRREAFNEDNLRAGMLRALEKRPVGMNELELVLSEIKSKLLSLGEREISSEVLGEWVMQALKKLDEIAYIRFASVYRCFQDINEFHKEIEKMQGHASNQGEDECLN